MPIPGWPFTIMLTLVVFATFAAESPAQTFGTPRTTATPAANGSSPTPTSAGAAHRKANANPILTGIVEGLPDDETNASPSLVQLAAESNGWMPTCEPPGPTRGLWGDCRPAAHGCSWQECIIGFRDGLGWVFSRPTCVRGVEPASDASAWDWVTQRGPRLGATSSGTCVPRSGATVWTIWSE